VIQKVVLLFVGVAATHIIATISSIKFSMYARKANFFERSVYLFYYSIHFFVGMIANTLLGGKLAYVGLMFVLGNSQARSLNGAIMYGAWLCTFYLLWWLLEVLDYRGII